MWNLKSVFVVILGGVLFLAVAAAHPPVLLGSTWMVNWGDPGRTGNCTTTIKISYADSNGAKQTKTISASVSLAPADTEEGKKQKVQGAVNAELAKDSNKVGGQPLATTGGTGDIMTITPSPNNPGGFSDAKIESVKVKDTETGEDDLIEKPDGKKGLAQVTPEGELLGQTSERGPSIFFVTTNLGTVSIQLTGSMSTLELLKALKAGLIAQDPAAEVWVDSDLNILFLKLDDGGDGIYSIGAGSTDQGLSAVCKVMITN